ncbi:acetyl-coenzyme A synthetase, cytoplasmic-like [Centruroides sculpturatus]|uniref:acetyl-coenzyme A synthetase, cytoplasmic-like n=1 Tax=Centruroides sculpturatus TaxID=218467 RepID=UPI000C6D91C5|nr:acetyl-coenzyme A synthetase, cytoplasmic-like [Centruroides sculpturatus]
MAVAIDGMFDKAYLPKQEPKVKSHVPSMEIYRKLYKEADENPDQFWGSLVKEFYWKKYPTAQFLKYNFDVSKGPIQIKWMEDASTNICYNALDKNIQKGLGNSIAFYWEGNDPKDVITVTYKKLHEEVCKFANVLRKKGVKKGDRIAIYMPMILELPIALLACARIGAVHSVVFGGYSSESLAERILDASCLMLITADGVYRGAKLINLKGIADEAVSICKERGHKLKSCIVVFYLNKPNKSIKSVKEADVDKLSDQLAKELKLSWRCGEETCWQYEMASVGNICEPEWMNAEDPLFILYTSGSTGKPKGILHTVAGYMLYAATTFKYVFDYQPGNVYFCTADIGWITGHTYGVYGPLLNGAISVMFEGIPFYPHPGRFWEIIDKYNVNIFYTAPTAIRALIKYGDEEVNNLKILGSVGEPINPEAWLWYYNVVGKKNCSVVDTFWQTETLYVRLSNTI